MPVDDVVLQTANIFIMNQCCIDLACSMLILVVFNLDKNERLSGLGGDILCKWWFTNSPLWSMLMTSIVNLEVRKITNASYSCGPDKIVSLDNNCNRLLMHNNTWLKFYSVMYCSYFHTYTKFHSFVFTIMLVMSFQCKHLSATL